MHGTARSKQDEPVVDDSSPFVFPPTIDPVVRERAWADGRLSIGTISRKTRNRSPTHRLPGQIILPEKLVQFVPIVERIAVVNRKPGNYAVGNVRVAELSE